MNNLPFSLNKGNIKMEMVKRGSTYFPVYDEENPNKKPSFVRTAGTKLQFADGTIVVYMPERMVKQYGKPVKRDATISVTYPWGKKEGAMSLSQFIGSFGDRFVFTVFKNAEGN